MRADFRLGDWIIRPRRDCIERGEEIVQVHSRPMAVLEYLAAAGGEVVTRDELFDNVWPGVIVTDDALTQCIVELRKAFGDSAHDPQVIKTIPKVGFCLVAPVSDLDEEPAVPGSRLKFILVGVLVLIVAVFAFYRFVLTDEEPTTVTVYSEQRASIVVLPFVNMSSDPEQEYFSDGISEELMNLLARTPYLDVISRTSAFSFKGKDVDIPTIAQQLGVTHVLEGSVRKAGNEIRTAAQLVEVSTDTHLWSQIYTHELADIFTIQDDIAKNVTDNIEGILVETYPQSVSTNPEAHVLYLKGKNHFYKYDAARAIQYFQQAIALDPQYANAHLALASCYGAMTFFGYMSPREGYEKYTAEVALAEKIDPDLPELHRAIGSINHYFNWDWKKAEEALQRAVSLVPSYAHAHQTYAWFLAAQSRFEEAQTVITRGLKLEPLAPNVYLTASNVFYLSGLHDQAIAHGQEALELSPNHSLALSQIGWSYLQLGLFDEAISIMEKSVKHSPGLAQNHYMLGHAYAVAGKESEARKIISYLHNLAEKQYVAPYGIAMIHAGLGETSEAIDWLEKAYEERNPWMAYLNVEPRWDPLRGEPRFQEVLARMAFPD